MVLHFLPQSLNFCGIVFRFQSTFSRTWRPSIESSILRQVDAAFPLTFDLRIAGISRRRSVKIAHAREYGRKFWLPWFWLSSKDVLKDVSHPRLDASEKYNIIHKAIFFFKYIRETFRKMKTYLKFQCESLLEFKHTGYFFQVISLCQMRRKGHGQKKKKKLKQ